MQPEGHFVNRYFDHVFVINLAIDLERRIKVGHMLDQYGIEYTIFDATNGYEGEPLKSYRAYTERELGRMERLPEFNERELQRGFGFIESPGAIGYLYTYQRLLKQAKAEGLNKILVLEDDTILSRDFSIRLDSFMHQLPRDWKVVQLGASQYDWSSVALEQAREDGYYYPRILHTCGSFAAAYDSSVFDQLIEAASHLEAPYDHLVLGEVYEAHLGKCFVAYPNMVMPDVTESRIRGSRDQELHSERMKWRMEYFDFPPPKPVVALLIESRVNLPWDLVKQRSGKYPIYLNVYANTRDGLRPVHDEQTFERYRDDLRPVPEVVSLPKADFCMKLTRGGVLSYFEILNAVADPGRLEASHNLRAWPFEQSQRVPGRITVIVPTYKRSDNLFNAIDSVLAQRGADFELLVIDDNGQPSPYARQIQDHLDRSSPDSRAARVELIQHSRNLNGAAARNTGIMAATGEYISFLDDDDMLLPGKLSESVRALENAKKGFGGVYCGYLGWNSPRNDPDRYPERGLSEFLLTLDYRRHYLHTDTVAYRMNELTKTNGFDESYPRHQDLEFNLRFLEVSNLGAVEEALVQLNPKPSTQDNRLFGHRLFQVKKKFLAEFEHVIREFDEATRERLYRAHWSEVARYVTDRDEFLASLAVSEGANAALQVYCQLQEESRGALEDRPAVELPAVVNDPDRLARAQERIEKLQEALDEKQRRLDEIENSLTWKISRTWRFLP